MKRNGIIFITIVAILAVCLSIWPGQSQSQIEDVSNFTGIHVANSTFATATPAFMVDQQGSTSNAIVEFRDAATPVFNVYSGGVTDVQGNKIDLDADADTSITADTDDTIHIEISAADEWTFTADQLDATDGQIVNIGAAGTDFNTSGGLTLAAGLTVTTGGVTLSDGDAVVADDIRTTAQTSITVTNAAAFTPTGTYQPITAGGTVTPTITAGATAGDLLVLINTSAQTINLADSGTAKLTAAFAMGQFDVLVLWSDGTNWVEISRANN